jgi:hypothetical protein
MRDSAGYCVSIRARRCPDGWSVRSIEPAQFDIAIESKRAQAWLATIQRV